MASRSARSSAFALAVSCAVAGFFAVPGATLAWAEEGQTARPELGKLIQAAEGNIQARKFDQAQKDLAKAEAIKGRSSYENYLIAQTRAALYQRSGDKDAALKAFRDLLDSGLAPASEKGTLEYAIAGAAADKAQTADAASPGSGKPDWQTALDYAQRARKDGEKNPALPGFIANAYYQSQDYKNAIAETQAQIAAQKKANQPPTEGQLGLIVAAADKAGDQATKSAALEQLAVTHPSANVWLNLVADVRKIPGINGRYGLDLLRFRFTAGLIDTPDDYSDYIQNALAEGYPGEAKTAIADADAKGKFGTDARAQKLHKYIDDRLAADTENFEKAKAAANDSHDGQGLVRLGFDLVTQGKADGIQLIQDGIKKGNLPHPEDATLRLGEAYARLGKTQDAIATLRTVTAAGGAKEVAHLWILKLQAPKTA